jgi:hypothetical protein
MRRLIVFAIPALIVTATPTLAQQVGRTQDGFYSGQTGFQSNGQIRERVDGRANRNEGVPPSTGDAAKRAAPVDRAVGNDAESVDAVERPGLPQR